MVCFHPRRSRHDAVERQTHSRRPSPFGCRAGPWSAPLLASERHAPRRGPTDSTAWIRLRDSVPRSVPVAEILVTEATEGSPGTTYPAGGCKLEVPNWNLKFGLWWPPIPAVCFLPLALTPYRSALMARRIRASSRRSFFFVSSCSQIRSTRHPCHRNVRPADRFLPLLIEPPIANSRRID